MAAQKKDESQEENKKKYISERLALDWDFTTKMLLAMAGRREFGYKNDQETT